MGMMFRAVVFTFMPTAIELVLVCTLLAQRFKPAVALLVLATFVAYVGWTTVMTKVTSTSAASVTGVSSRKRSPPSCFQARNSDESHLAPNPDCK